MPPARNVSINLLTQDEFSSTALGKVLLWALSIGRYIVVFTELIVILSFLSRFKLDRDLTDLNEEIARQKAIILSYGDLETRFNHAQAQLALVKQVRGQVLPDQILNLLSKIQPTDVRLESFDYSDNSLKLTGLALSAPSFSTFIQALSQSELLTDVSLDSVKTTDNGLTLEFELSANLTSPS